MTAAETTDLAPVQEHAITPAQHIEKLMESKRGAIEEVISDRLGFSRLLKLTQLAMSRNPKLFDCTPVSILTSVMDAARLGLDPSGTLNSAYLVPHYNGRTKQMECQLIPGYGGLIDLVCRSGKVRNVESRVVYHGDEFDVQYGTDPKIVHRPAFGEKRDETITHAYAVFYFRDGGCQFEVMDRMDIDTIRSKALSKTKGYGPWKDHFSEMARKCPIRRAVKTLSIEIDETLAHAVELNDRMEAEHQAHVREAEQSKEDRIGAALKGSKD
jgi:recombination protein RecT